MPKPKFTEQFLVTVTSDQPIKDLCDHVANRLWSLDHVTFIDVALIKSVSPFDKTSVVLTAQVPIVNDISHVIDKLKVAITPVADIVHVAVDAGLVKIDDKPLLTEVEREAKRPTMSGYIRDLGPSKAPRVVDLLDADDRPMLMNANAFNHGDI